MAFINWFSENIILPSSDLVLGQSISKHLAWLNESQHWTRNEIDNFQNERLSLLIRHSYQNVPYYTNLFNSLNIKPKDITKKEDLFKLPIITKKEIKNNIEQLLATNLNKKNLVYSSSSGSTGEPLQFYRSKEAESLMKASALRGWYWMGYRLGDKFIKISQNPRTGIKVAQDFLSRNRYLHSKQLDEENFRKIIDKIVDYNPQFLRSYPDPLNFLLNYVEKNNIKLPSLKGINTTGNILFEKVREKAERLFSCNVYDQFSCEGGAIVFECPTHNCYHSAEEYAISEILNEENQPVNKGRLVTTDLWNFATPFIRYDTQDIVETSNNLCPCGRTHLPINKIYGRDSDILISKDGKFLIVHNFTGYFEWVKEVDHFQVRQEEIGKFNIYLKVNDSYNPKVESSIKKYWEEYIGKGNDVNIFVLSDIPLSQSGKRRFLIRSDNVPLPNN